MILGLILALTAGSLLSLQNIFNSKVNERAGSWATTTLVLGMGTDFQRVSDLKNRIRLNTFLTGHDPHKCLSMFDLFLFIINMISL